MIRTSLANGKGKSNRPAGLGGVPGDWPDGGSMPSAVQVSTKCRPSLLQKAGTSQPKFLSWSDLRSPLFFPRIGDMNAKPQDEGCLICGSPTDGRRRGLCSRHYQQFAYQMRSLGDSNAREVFEKTLIRDGKLAPPAQGKRTDLTENPFSDYAAAAIAATDPDAAEIDDIGRQIDAADTAYAAKKAATGKTKTPAARSRKRKTG